MSKNYCSIKSDGNIIQLERYIQDPRIENCTLRLPSKLREGGSMGRSASIAQFVATWASRTNNPSLKTYISSEDAEKFENYVSNLHGLSAVYFSNKVFTLKSDQDIRYELLLQAVPRFKAMQTRNFHTLRKRRIIEIISVVHARSEFLTLLYRQTPGLSELLDRQRHGQLIALPQEMNGLFQNCVESINISYRSQPLVSSLVKDHQIGILLHEAIRNTAEHAYLTNSGTIPKRGLRCVLFSINPIERDRLRAQFPITSTDRTTLTSYFQKVAGLGSKFERKKIDFLEISILDTGPGFAETMRISADGHDDFELVAQCFESFKSSKPGENSGQGLYRILSAVKELNGFIRIRTSSCEIFFCSEDNFDEYFDPRPLIRGELGKVIGTLLTICIPIAY